MEDAAALGEDGIQVMDRMEVLVGDGLVDQRPEMLCGLEFGAVGRLVDEPHALRDGQVFRCVPAGIVEFEDDDAIASSAGLTREGLKQLGEERLVDAVR
jgi:hypothetical protein